jgi:hypothetical protein
MPWAWNPAQRTAYNMNVVDLFRRPTSHDLELMLYTNEILEKYIYTQNMDSELAGKQSKRVLQLYILHRTVTSYFAFDRRIPGSQRKVIKTEFGEFIYKIYKSAVKDSHKYLFMQEKHNPKKK